MKTNVYLTAAVALVLSACSTGSYVSTGYVDDIYFNPRDIPPPIVVEETVQKQEPVRDKAPDRVIISEITENEEGSKTMNNYIYDAKDANEYTDAQRYNMQQMELEGSDTTVYYNDDDIKYVINNYYDGDELDYTYRIRRFHRPYFYDPFYWNDWYWNDWYWDSWYYPYSSYYGWGYDPWYGGMYGGWYGSMYGGWYGSMYGGMYGGWYSPYSYWGYGYPYYGWGNYGYWGHNGYWSDDENWDRNFRYGRNSDFSNYTTSRGGGNPERSVMKSGQVNPDNRGSSGVVTRSVNPGNNVRSERETSTRSQNGTMSEMRRNNLNASGSNRVNSDRQTQYTRPAASSTGATQNRSTNSYSPSYNQQRSTTRSTYNVPDYSRPAPESGNQSGGVKNAQRSSTVYSRPSSSSSSERSYRSGSTYNRSSNSGTNNSRSYSPSSGGSSYSSPSRSSSGSYSSPGNSSSGSSYSSPSRSSYSGGSSSSGSSSSGSSGGSSGGGSSSGGRSGSGGRR